MRLFLVVFVAAMALSAAGPQAQKKQKQQTRTAAAKAAGKAADDGRPASVPADAVQDAAGDYRYTDPQGQKWIYRKTPFGMMRVEDRPEPAAASGAASGDGIKATEDGDKVRFERLTPFGVRKWEKKKSELDESEKAALENSQGKGPRQDNNSTVTKQD